MLCYVNFKIFNAFIEYCQEKKNANFYRIYYCSVNATISCSLYFKILVHSYPKI